MDNNALEQKEEYYRNLHKGKTPEQIVQESYNHHKNLIQEDKAKEQKEVSDRIGALRAIFNAYNPLPSSKF